MFSCCSFFSRCCYFSKVQTLEKTPTESLASDPESIESVEVEETPEARVHRLVTASDWLFAIKTKGDEKATILDVQGKGFTQLLGWECENVIGRSAFDIIHQMHSQEVIIPLYQKTLREGQYSQPTYLIEYKHKNGGIVPLMARPHVKIDPNSGAIVESDSLVYFVDPDAVNRVVERQVKEAESEIAARVIAATSHEFRNALNGIIGNVNLLKGEDLSVEEQKEGLESVGNLSNHLLNVCEQMMENGALHTGNVSLKLRRFSLEGILRQLSSTLKEKADKHHTKLEVLIPEEKLFLQCDGNRLEQILINLIGNAIKFASKSWVKVETKVVSKKESFVTLRFSVEDGGIGMSSEQLARVCLPFQQATDSTKQEYGGVGIGLSIVDKYIKLMGGQLNIESELGKGSCFSFTLTFKRASRLKKPRKAVLSKSVAEKVEKISRLSILIVDDVSVNRRVLERTLCKKFKLPKGKVGVAVNGQEALSQMGEGSRKWDVILMDVQMPVMDGLQATSEIRSKEEKGERIPIYALTGNIDEKEKLRCLGVGMDGVMTKPFADKVLSDVLYAVALAKEKRLS